MNLRPLSFDGVTIHNGTTLIAKLPGDSGMNQSPVNLVFSPVSGNYPNYSTRVLQPRDVVVLISLAGTPHSQVDTLNAAFDVRKGECTFIATDEDASSKQWYLKASVARQPQVVGATYRVTLRAAFGIWRTVTGLTDTSWTATASGQTHNLGTTPTGNANSLPTVTFTPNSAKSGGFSYARYVLITNAFDTACNDWLDLTDGGLNTAAIVADTSKSNQINNAGGLAIGAGATCPIDTAVGGGLAAAGYCYVDTEQIQYTISGSTFTAVTRGLNGTSAATHLDNAVIKWSRTQADGDDWRVYIDGVEVDRAFGTSTNAFNLAATKIFSRVPLQARIEIGLGVAIDNSTAITEIYFQDTKAYRTLFGRLPSSGQLIIGSEAFTWTGKDAKAFKLTGVKRTVFSTTIAAHAVGDACKWMEHIIQIVYGDFTLGAPVTDTTRTPIWDLTSTNLSHVYTSMSDAAGLRAGRWAGSILSYRSRGRGDTGLYTGNQTAQADPATELGVTINSWKSGSRYQDENADIVWTINVPQGVTTVTATGEKRRTSSDWPTYTFEASINGSKWINIWTEATPSGSAAWENWSAHSAVALGATYYWLRFRMKGSVGAGSGYYAASELNDITLTLASKPTITLGAEVASPYDLNVKLSNSATSEYFTVRRMIDVGQSLQVNLKTRVCTYLKDNTVGPRIEYPDTQTEPMTLKPAVTNTFTITETGLANMDIDFAWEDWNL